MKKSKDVPLKLTPEEYKKRLEKFGKELEEWSEGKRGKITLDCTPIDYYWEKDEGREKTAN